MTIPDLDTLGKRHKKLLADMDALVPQLAEAIRAERAAGATYADLMTRSGYRSIETIRQIVKPTARDAINGRRRHPVTPPG
jgi:hypothetical protein